MKHLREMTRSQERHVFLDVLRRWFVWYIPPVFGAFLSVLVGPLSGFDLVNLRWMAGWVMISGADGLYGSVASLLTRSWLHDAAIALLLEQRLWWLGPAILGAVHGLIVPIIYRTIRLSASQLSKTGTAVLAWTSILSPLVLMHIGRETGHLFAALFLGLSVRLFLKNEKAGLGIGLLLGFAPLLKVSALLPALVFGMAFAIGLKGVQRVRVLIGAIGVLWFGSLLQSLLFAARSATWSQIWVWGHLFSTFRVGIISLGLLIAIRWCIGRSGTDRSNMQWLNSSRISTTFLVSGIAILTWYIRESDSADPRFRPPPLGHLIRQLLMSGNSRAPISLSDWEVLYLDNSRIVLVAFSAVAGIMMLIHSQWTSVERRMLLASLAIGGSVILVQASMGYVRYASPSIALLPIAVGCVIGVNRGKRLWREVMLFSVSAIVLLPVFDTGTWFRAPGLRSYEGFGTLLDEEEVRLLSNLLPADSMVFLYGSGTTSAAPVTGRTDIQWQLSPKRPDQVGRDFATLIYNPGETVDLDKFSTRGWNFEICQVLRFKNISYGWCAMSAGP